MYAESPRFSLAYQYARKTCDKVYILSAKYGLLSEKEMIEPYNETLNEKSTQERKVWSKKIVESIRKIHSLENDEFMILAGRSYYEYIIPYLMHYL